jgi:hypothetical protein
MTRQLHDMDAELQCLRASQNHGTPGSGMQENLFQCIIPGTQPTNTGEQKAGHAQRGIIPLSEIEKMTADDVTEDSGSELSSVSAFIRSLPDVELPLVSENTIRDALPTPATVQEQPGLAAKAANSANTKRKYETIAPPGGQVKGDRAPASGPSRSGSEPQNGPGRFASIFDRLEQQRSQQPPGAQPSFDPQVKEPNTRRQSNRSTATVEMSERPSKFARTSKPGATPLDKQTGRNYQTPQKLTTVPESPPHGRREKQTKAASTRKSRRIKQMDIMRAKFEEDGPSRQTKA